MEPTNYAKLPGILKSGTTGGVVLVMGDEPLFVEKSIQAVRDFCKQRELVDFNLSEFSAEDMVLDRFWESVRAEPLFAEERVVIVRKANKAKKPVRDALQIYVKTRTPTTILVLECPAADEQWSKMLGDRALLVDCARLTRRQVSSWVRKWLLDRGHPHDKEMVQAISMMLSGPLAVMNRQLSTLQAYLRGEKLTVELASRVLGEGQSTYRDMVKAFRAQDEKAFQYSVQSLWDTGIAPRQMMSVLVKELILLLRAFALMDEGVPMFDIAEDVGVPTYFLKDLFVNRKVWEEVDPVDCLNSLKDASDLMMLDESSPTLVVDFFYGLLRKKKEAML